MQLRPQILTDISNGMDLMARPILTLELVAAASLVAVAIGDAAPVAAIRDADFDRIVARQRCVMPAGDYRVSVRASSCDLQQSVTITLLRERMLN